MKDSTMSEIMEKVLDVDRLPTYEEARQLLQVYAARNTDNWVRFVEGNGVHNLYNVEFIDALADEIKKLEASPIVEICAGNGKLSNHLRMKEVDIIATDDYSWDLQDGDNSLVERLGYYGTLQKHQPKVVVASWIPSRESNPAGSLTYSHLRWQHLGLNLLFFPSVRYFIDIEPADIETWEDDERSFIQDLLEDRLRVKGWRRTYLENLQKLNLTKTDIHQGDSNSCISLFRRE